MESSQPFFILGLPRSRTAWLSVVMSMCGAPCTHEGMRGCADFADYAQQLEGGDADPVLIFWTAQLLEKWPRAVFVIVERNDENALKSLLAASCPEDQESIKANWGTAVQAFSVARDMLRANPHALFVKFDDLRKAEVVQEIVQHIGGNVPSVEAIDRWQLLNVTTTLSAAATVTGPRPAAPVHSTVFQRSGCDIEGLSASFYVREEFETVSQWWKHHSGQPLAESSLPPLGIVVSLRGLPVAAIWVYECYGAPVAELAFPVTKPGLCLKDARRSLAYGISTAITSAGKLFEPEAVFKVFKVLAPEGTTRFLERLGFEHAQTDRKPMLLTL